MECLFCKLGKQRENLIFENELLFVIVDRYPISKRHFLIIPKQHSPFLHDYDENVLAAMVSTAKMIVLKFKLVKYNLLQNNINEQLIMHCHMHIIEAGENGKLTLGSMPKLSWSDEEYSAIIKELKEKLEDASK